tara:strand:+ start:12155 stop:13678 length:1524 start_codon:yes stop_codon:yes gene_type:complete
MSMPYKFHGKHLIGGEWCVGEGHFDSAPASGPASSFSEGTLADVDRACEAAEDAFRSYGYSARDDRAEFLLAIADEIEARAETITAVAAAESGLPEPRLQAERSRTVGQLRLFAEHIQRGDYLDRRYDVALPERKPLPRPDLRVMQRPIGPVAVFGASNFPLAFSTAGGDTAAALAAGCPVVVKGHPSHPGTGEVITEAIYAAVRRCGVHPGVFSNIQGRSHDAGQALVQHPLVRAVGFTGSLAGGRALFDLCAARPEPIPFFGELGSVNPMFLLPGALANRGSEIAAGWAASLTTGAGQFCTNPGIAIVPEGQAGDDFVEQTGEALSGIEEQVMANDAIATAYRRGRERVATQAGVRTIMSSQCGGRNAAPCLYETTAANWLANPMLAEEVFGPLGLVVRCEGSEQMESIAYSLEGQLSATLHMDDSDVEAARRLLPLLERKAGRVLANGFPTGVDVVDAMVHGGPYPASTNFGATSVGTLSIRRFLRPVCYQNLPASMLPDDLLS